MNVKQKNSQLSSYIVSEKPSMSEGEARSSC